MARKRPHEAAERARIMAARAAGAAAAAREAITTHPGLTREGMPIKPETFGLPENVVLAMPARGQVLYRLASEPLRGKDFESKLIRQRPRGAFEAHLVRGLVDVHRRDSSRVAHAPITRRSCRSPSR